MIASFLHNNRIALIGMIIGGILGYAYYHFIGCNSGSCAITSKPFNSTAYGMLMGYLGFSTFDKQNKKEK